MEPTASIIVGVHGIAQQQLGRHQLREPWRRSLADGLERASGTEVPLPPLDIAYYGDLFLPTADDSKGGGEPSDEPAGAEAAELAAAVDEIVAEPTGTAEEKAFTRSPLPLQGALRLLDRQFGAALGSLCLGELRQVQRYLRDVAIRPAVDERVDAAVTPHCRVLVGHSLGSVVALVHVLRHPERRFDLLLTLGSPLGLRLILDRIAPGSGPLSRPASVARWVDVRDPRDPVASVRVASRWDGVQEHLVDNQSHAHAAERYLGKRVTGEAVLAVVPDLVP